MIQTPREVLEARVADAARQIFGADWKMPEVGLVGPCPDARHGDFQTNVAMTQAKAVGENPRALAQKIADALQVDDIAAPPELAGPGFINFRLKPEYVRTAVLASVDKIAAGPSVPEKPLRVVVEFSSPNAAKEMHIGHIRSTILGDCLARLLRYLKYTVITDNHLGDRGTNFGMLLHAYRTWGDPAKLEADPLGYPEELYVRANEAAKTDENIRVAARAQLILMQEGDPEANALWKRFVDTSWAALEVQYKRLGVQFDYVLGESVFVPRLPGLVEELLASGIARPSEGAICAFFDDHPQLKDHPCMIRKSDGGFLYATTDVATFEHRVKHPDFRADWIIISTDGRQQMHFQQVFEIGHRMGLRARTDHVWFGAILGPDKKPFKTREGSLIKMRELLDEAESRALEIVTNKRPEMPEAARKEVARKIGLGAVKYADLCQNRNLDYVFSWDRLLSFDGNTAPYLQNAYVRIRAIFRKLGDWKPDAAQAGPLTEAAEIDLAKKLLNFLEIVRLVVEEGRPHHLCQYLFELAGLFHRFYEACPVSTAEPPAKHLRALLCDATAETLRTGLGLLGVEVMEEM